MLRTILALCLAGACGNVLAQAGGTIVVGQPVVVTTPPPAVVSNATIPAIDVAPILVSPINPFADATATAHRTEATPILDRQAFQSAEMVELESGGMRLPAERLDTVGLRAAPPDRPLARQALPPP